MMEFNFEKVLEIIIYTIITAIIVFTIINEYRR